MTDDGVVTLHHKDALSLLRLLRGLDCLVHEERLDERQCADELMGVGPVDERWQERLRGEVSAACGLLQELLEGYDPASRILARGQAASYGLARMDGRPVPSDRA